MNDANPSMPDSAQGQTQDQGNEVNANPGLEQPKSFSLDDMSPEDAANLFGLSEASQEVAELVGETKEQPEVRADEEEQSEEEPEEEISDSSADDETDDVESSDEPEADETDAEQGEPLVYDIKQLEDENIVLSMKVDGEFREFSMGDIQKAVGQSTTADEKSRKAAEEMKQVEDVRARTYEEQRMLNDRAEVMGANQQLSVLAQHVQHLDNQIADGEANGHDVRELKLDRNEALQNYNAIYNGAQQLVNQNKARHQQIQRQRLGETSIGQKFLGDQEYRKDVGAFLHSLELGPEVTDHIMNDAGLTQLVIGYYESQNAVKPKAKRSKPKKLSQTMAGRASSSKPASKKTPFQTLMDSGPVSLSDLADNKHLLG